MSAEIFHPAFGSKPDRIIGRDAVIEEFVAGLRRNPGHRDRATLILGQRGMGKTALLLKLAEEAQARGFVVARVTAGQTMLDEIIETVQIEGAPYVKGGEKRTKVKGFSAGALGFSFGLTFSDEVRDNYGFRVKLGLLSDKLAEAGRGILILVDEVQASSEEMRLLASTYQHLIGDGKDVAIAMAGLPNAISNVLNDDVLTFLNRARKVRLEAIKVGEVMAYYAEAFERIGKSFGKGQLESSAAATRGFPYLLQLVGYYLVEYSQATEEISSAVVASAVQSAQDDLVQDVFAPTLKALSPTDVEVLEAIARSGEGAVSVAELQKRLGISNSYLQQYRARLIEAGVVDSPQRGKLEITLPYLGEHLRG